MPRWNPRDGAPRHDFHDDSTPAGPYEVPLSFPASLRPPSCPLGLVPSNGTLLASLGDGVLAMADGALGLQEVLAGLDDLKLLDSWFSGRHDLGWTP